MQVPNHSISIIGCGWLGLPMAKTMLDKGWQVKGTTTSPGKRDLLLSMGVQPYLIQLPMEGTIDDDLFDSDFLLINLPPGRRNPDVSGTYPKAIAQIVNAAKNQSCIGKIIFISSTSVYGHPDDRDVIDEETVPMPETESGLAIWHAEQLVKECGISSVILRFGGLAGPARHPGRFLAGRHGLNNGHQSVNFLHLDDAIGVVEYMLENHIKNDVFNVVAPQHPSKRDFYTKMAMDIDMEAPTFEPSRGKRRQISPLKLLNNTNYHFLYPDPMRFEY